MLTEYRVQIAQEAGYEIVLSNLGKDRKPHPVHRSASHLADWVGHIVPPGKSLKDCLDWIPQHSWPVERLVQWSNAADKTDLADGFMKEALMRLAEHVPDSTSLEILVALGEGLSGIHLAELIRSEFGRSSRGYRRLLHLWPDSVPGLGLTGITETIIELRDKWFPRREFEGQTAPAASYKGNVLEMPIRAVAALACAALAGEEANRGDYWYREYLWQAGRAQRAGCRFTHALYVLRQHTPSSPRQLARILQVSPWD